MNPGSPQSPCCGSTPSVYNPLFVPSDSTNHDDDVSSIGRCDQSHNRDQVDVFSQVRIVKSTSPEDVSGKDIVNSDLYNPSEQQNVSSQPHDAQDETLQLLEEQKTVTATRVLCKTGQDCISHVQFNHDKVHEDSGIETLISEVHRDKEQNMGNQSGCSSGKAEKDGTDTEPECEPHLHNPKVLEEKALSLERDTKSPKSSKKDKQAKKKDTSLLKSPKGSKKKGNSEATSSSLFCGNNSLSEQKISKKSKHSRAKQDSPVLEESRLAQEIPRPCSVSVKDHLEVMESGSSPRKDFPSLMARTPERRASPSHSDRHITDYKQRSSPTPHGLKRDRDDDGLSGSSREQTLRKSFERYLSDDSETQLLRSDQKPDDDASSTSTGYVTADDGVYVSSDSHAISDRVRKVGMSIEQTVIAKLSDVSNANLNYDDGSLLDCEDGVYVHVGASNSDERSAETRVVSSSPPQSSSKRCMDADYELYTDKSDMTVMSKPETPVLMERKVTPEYECTSEKVQEMLNDICNKVENLKKNGKQHQKHVSHKHTNVESSEASSQSENSQTSYDQVRTENPSPKFNSTTAGRPDIAESGDKSTAVVHSQTSNGSRLNNEHRHSSPRTNVLQVLQDDTGTQPDSEHVPPPSPSAMDILGEVDEDLEENGGSDDTVLRQSKDLEAFGESVCQRLSWLLETSVDKQLEAIESNESNNETTKTGDKSILDELPEDSPGIDADSDSLLNDFVVVNEHTAASLMEEPEGGVATALDMVNNNFSTPDLTVSGQENAVEVLGAEGGYDDTVNEVDIEAPPAVTPSERSGVLEDQTFDEPLVRSRRKADVHSDVLPLQIEYKGGVTQPGTINHSRHSDGCDERMSVDLSESQNEYNERLESQAKSLSSVGGDSLSSASDWSTTPRGDVDMMISPTDCQASGSTYFADNDAVFDDGALLASSVNPDGIDYTFLQRLSSDGDSSDIDATEDLMRSAAVSDRNKPTRLSTASANSMELPEPTAIDAEMKMLEVDACRIPLSTATITRQQIAQISADCEKLLMSDESNGDASSEGDGVSSQLEHESNREVMLHTRHEDLPEQLVKPQWQDEMNMCVVEEVFEKVVITKLPERIPHARLAQLDDFQQRPTPTSTEQAEQRPIDTEHGQVDDQVTTTQQRSAVGAGEIVCSSEPDVVRPKRESEIICDVIGSYTGGGDDEEESRSEKQQRVLDESLQEKEILHAKCPSVDDNVCQAAALSLPVSTTAVSADIADLAQLCYALGAEDEDKTPVAEALPEIKTNGEPDAPSDNARLGARRSITCTESDLDTSEQRDDGSTDSMYADDEDDDTTELLFSQCYTEPGGCSGSEVLVSCTVVNSSFLQPDAYDSDDIVSRSSAAEEAYRELASSADVVSSTFINARHQMQDIHFHLQSLRRQMETLHQDVAGAHLTPPYYLDTKSSVTDSSDKPAFKF